MGIFETFFIIWFCFVVYVGIPVAAIQLLIMPFYKKNLFTGKPLFFKVGYCVLVLLFTTGALLAYL
ncbi:MAG: hypothetical protein Q8Q23_03535 [bacterium]|nr:hypothetical protein [bacterium]